MSKFEQWWQKEEDLMRKQGADDEIALGAMRSIAEMAWDAASDKAADAVSARMDVISAMMEKQAGTQEGATLRSMWMILSNVLSSIKEMKNE